jgi:SAM-dependent methyltransferase
MTGRADTVHHSNADAWNETSAWYARRADELRETLADGCSTLHQQEHKLLRMLPPLDSWCELAVHLQCAAGFDTISLTNLGARRAVGVDISTELTHIATALADKTGAPVSFRCADVLEVQGLEGQADLVYTGKGAIHWMFDLAAWASKVAGILRPGGWFLLFDFHPMVWLFREGADGLEVNPVSYFAPVIKYRDWAPGHFGGPDSSASEGGALKQLRPWPPSAVIQSLIGAGLELAVFHEYPDNVAGDWTAYPRATAAERARVASTYAVMAQKPGHRS